MFLDGNVMWIFSYPKPEIIPSYIVSGIMPADYLGIQKVIFLDHHDPKKFLINYKPKLIIINKAFHFKIINLIREAKNLNIKIISIFDDWHFAPKNNNTKKQFNFYEIMARNSDCLVVKTDFASDLIRKNTGLEAKVISDCLRFKSKKAINNINTPLNICWFGMHTNHDTLEFGLKEILDKSIKCKIKIITNKLEELSKRLSYIKAKEVTIEFVKWTKKMDDEVIKTDIVIIPYINDHKRLVKSYNRIIDSINLGRFTIVSNVSIAKKFEKFCYLGNIGNGLIWAQKNEKKVILKVNNGMKFIKNNYSIEFIAKKWSDLINIVIQS